MEPINSPNLRDFSKLVAENNSTGWPFKKNENYIRKEPIDQYDMVIKIDSLKKCVENGIPIQLHSSVKKKWSELQSTPIVSVLGLYNKGKTYVLSRIFDLKLESSFFSHTEGLSFITSKSSLSNVLIGLDTKGSNTPIKCTIEKMGDEIIDSQYTEVFIREITLFLSDIVLIVVDRLTRDDQLYIQQVRQKYSTISGKDVNNIIIIHNLSHCRDIDQMDKVVKEEVVEAFCAKAYKNIEKSPYYVGQDGIRHVVMCADENGFNGTLPSNAGKQVNKKTIELVCEWLRASSSISQKPKNNSYLYQFIKENMNKIIGHYFSEQYSLEIDSALNDNPSFTINGIDPKASKNPTYVTNLKIDMAGVINGGSNTQPCMVKEDPENYYLDIDCTGYEKESLSFAISESTILKVKSNCPRCFGITPSLNTIHNDFRSNETLGFEYKFAKMVEDKPTKLELKNGVLKLTIKKKKTVLEYKIEEFGI
ncbi:hypothetical protein DICPUDRAFT_148758 [Dictyostelium purpureum]|uniref:SHSP domain-containing protein n=1 Tax=Dictyostelium purpureum TaxID=5786 RepID=F0ZBX5_DICPU|nr:uncharacterized protein DICPUDRAFT_148758 [Dictyostelium purpureum]EGC38563.1 hypothetical protein DICPUDRAFT_148758 [Dictyostelium purpureum]|eukprot:XP_003284934.1 hypothetical protein DICPUDRAFT_148758 [Dictyostelium purpureum]